MDKEYKEYFIKILDTLRVLEEDNKIFKSEFKNINKKLDRIERRQQINTLTIAENQDRIKDLELKF